MSIGAVIFDLDGTLLDTLEDITAALNSALVEAGFPPVTSEESRKHTGWGARELVRRSLPEQAADDALIDLLAGRFSDAYRREPVVHTRPYPGVQSLLTRMRNATIKTAVLSNKPDELVQMIVDRAFSDHRFDAVRGGRTAVSQKPDPGSTREILQSLAVSPGNCVFVGDSEVDMETARNAGCVPVGVSWGFRDVSLLREAGAVHICYSADEIRELLGLTEQREDLQ